MTTSETPAPVKLTDVELLALAMAEEFSITEEQSRDLAFEGFQLGLEIKKLETRVKLIKRVLIREAANKPKEHVPIGAADGTAWKRPAAGCVATVTFPADKLKQQLGDESEAVTKLRKLIPDEADWSDLFTHVDAWKPVPDFRKKVEEKFPEGTKAQRIIKLVEGDSEKKVTWEEAA